jgi:hypothetical protein
MAIFIGAGGITAQSTQDCRGRFNPKETLVISITCAYALYYHNK